MWLHNVADGTIWLAYMAIPVILIYFIRRRPDVPFTKVFWMFGAFIVLCGLTHITEVVMSVQPMYRLSALVKLATAGVSVVTAIALVPILPMALTLRSPKELDAINRKLEAEIAVRKEAERLKDEFIANVSHELRTPLTLILSPLETLLTRRDGPRPEGETDEFHRVMHHNAVRLLQMINGLLDFSKLGAGKIEVRREPVDVVKLSRAVLFDFEGMFRERGLTAEFASDPPVIAASIDRHLYERILFNLLSNALKFTSTGGISVSLRRRDGRLRLSVRDSGCGIAPDDLPKLFQRFRQLEGSATRRFEGTGLGLALVKEFAGLLGGGASVESEPGRGSVFTVEFDAPECAAPDAIEAPGRPRPVVTLRSAPPAPEPEKRTAGEDDPNLPKLLVVEDNAELASYITAVVRGLCRTTVVVDGEEALRRVGEWKPDLVLSDIMMPKKDGLALCRDIKGDPATARIPVVLLTALTQREALLRGWEAGADEYLFKPFHPEELTARLKSLLAAVGERKRREAEEKRAAVEEGRRLEAEREKRELQDLNERLEARVEERTAQYRTAIQELDGFAHTVAHDLRAPVRAMNGFSQILIEEHSGGLSPVGRDYLHRITEAGTRLDLLIQDLLAYTRLTRAEIPLGGIALRPLLDSVLEQMAAELSERKAEVVLAGDFPDVVGHELSLTQALTNLLSNAAKFTAPGVVPRIRVTAEKAGGRVRVRVEDNGIGIAPEHVNRLFKIFERLHGREAYPGTGVGLAIVRRAMERMSGGSGVESTPGKGSRFWIELPAAGSGGAKA